MLTDKEIKNAKLKKVRY